MKKWTLAILLMSGSLLSAQNGGYYGGHPSNNNNPWNYSNGAGNWNNSWNSYPNPNRGACFYTSQNFGGNHFCVRSGERLDRLPGNFGDNISSIKLFGGARAVVFNDRNFSGGSQPIDRSVADLRNYAFRGGHTWNNRISSMAVK